LLGLGAVPFIGVMAQALIGGISVLTQLNPTVVAVHFLVSMFLIAGSTLLLLVAVPADPAATTSAGDSRPVPVMTRRLAVAAGVTAALVLTLGTAVTGSGPHSGDADDPNRFSFDIPLVTKMHSGLVWLFVLLVIAIIVTLVRAKVTTDVRTWALALLAATLAQGVIGYLQYALGVPAPLVAIHMLGASLFVITTTGTVYSALRSPATPAPSSPTEPVSFSGLQH
jgi:cytochrome c oxidase assembly protein subunit 15